MKIDKKYVTQLSAADMKELAQAANVKVRLPLRIERHEDSVEIYIEENKLKDMLWCFVNQAFVVVPRVAREKANEVVFDERT